MPLIKNKYGKGRVRVMRIHRDGDTHEVSQLNVKAMIEGDFARAYTEGDNSTLSRPTPSRTSSTSSPGKTPGFRPRNFARCWRKNTSTPIRRSHPWG